MSSTSKDFPRAPITFPHLRDVAHDGLDGTEARRYWWPILVKLKNPHDIDKAPDVINSSIKKYTWAVHSFNGNHEKVEVSREYNDSELEVVPEVMKLLTRQFQVHEPGTIEPLVRHLSRVVGNKAICFSMSCDVLDRPGWYISPTAPAHRLKLYTLRELIKLYMIQTYTALERINALEDEHLNIFLLDLFSPILTPEQVDRIIDGFLMDGMEVIYRYAVALLSMFKKTIKSGRFSSGAQFWGFMREHQQGGVDFAALKTTAFEDKKLLFFGKRMIPRRSVMSGIEEECKAALGDRLREPLGLSVSCCSASTSLVTFKEEGVRLEDSRIMDENLVNILNSFIPLSDRMEGFELMFATHNDGWSFANLYSRTENLAPCIIVCKSVESKSVFGMYVSCPISPPSSDIRGDGGCFCFRLNGSEAAKYVWRAPEVGPGKLQRRLSTNSHTLKIQFASCTDSYMAFGGSKAHSTNALRIDSDLSMASTGHSDTYDNPVLVSEESKSHFSLGDVEVYCGRTSVTSSGLPKSTLKKDSRK